MMMLCSYLFLCLSFLMSYNCSTTLMMILMATLSFHLHFFGDLSWNSIFLQIDSLSFSLSSLTFFISTLALLASMLQKMILIFYKFFSSLIFSLTILLSFIFTTKSTLLFYIMFEASILPTLLLILGWGNYPERKQASTYMLIYTVSASLPLLMAIIIVYTHNFSFSFLISSYLSPTKLFAQILNVSFMMAFMVKLPLYLVYMWLPKAHVEAPVSGSMMLAAILLKLGGYGLIRFFQMNHIFLEVKLNYIFLVWACLGGVYASVLCFFQTDIKMLIAMSSVAHMALVFIGILTCSSWVLNSVQIIMVGHAFCSSGLFCMENMLYERSKTRSMFLLKNTQIFLPPLCFWWLLLCFSNMASPPSLNLLGEMMAIPSLLLWSYSLIPLVMSLIMLSAAFSLYLFSATQHSKISKFLTFSHPLTPREHLLTLSHWLPLIKYFILVFFKINNLLPY